MANDLERDVRFLKPIRGRHDRSSLRLLVDSLGAPRIEFLNEAGQVTYSLTDAGQRR
jgi:hypothetical protein